jgi:hypothetical protein
MILPPVSYMKMHGSTSIPVNIPRGSSGRVSMAIRWLRGKGGQPRIAAFGSSLPGPGVIGLMIFLRLGKFAFGSAIRSSSPGRDEPGL